MINIISDDEDEDESVVLCLPDLPGNPEDDNQSTFEEFDEENETRTSGYSSDISTPVDRLAGILPIDSPSPERLLGQSPVLAGNREDVIERCEPRNGVYALSSTPKGYKY